ncbi:Snf7-domain-containing protein [Pseudovirgaria hyperparasitica]|uniref:Vacuolar-sorting protein SNF7 n=1 Tax=Pseudovirgaria hyperparasitica TaxID=470096 RepID=A0A6A6WK57_9PEZI|nr:Snf7-domain-containing protein [Pseudovirgaria hyperparasitica]KAF2762451.1 Snf7-domain-containing protein [Pseudovirgaria hyperparasitica]
MSGWGFSLFGGGGKAKNAPKEAIIDLRKHLEMLSKRETHLQNQMSEYDATARKYVTTNKKAAKEALRKKKDLEPRLEQTSAQIMTLERQIYSIENANINKETFDAMKKANAAMKQIHNGLTQDKVDQTMEELREQHAIGEDISEAITQSMGTQIADDDELEDELEQLQQEQLDENLLKTGSVPVGDKVSALPSAPHHVKPVEQEEDDEEEELRKLQAEMAM